MNAVTEGEGPNAPYSSLVTWKREARCRVGGARMDAVLETKFWVLKGKGEGLRQT